MKTTRKTASKKLKKQKYMSDELFGELMQSLDQALRYSRGEQINARATTLPAPPEPMTRQEIIKLRERFNCSQTIFARLLNVSVKTLQAWEQGLRTPSDAALKLLNIAKNHPEALIS
ncbi:MAG TPA: helix-turn-helix domain-containing protein [Blastocatellia bacterium]|jgi:putative transcriptional regulator|nr:helix-turn-helix domain-containing protein [Blastocatellia bacterium]